MKCVVGKKTYICYFRYGQQVVEKFVRKVITPGRTEEILRTTTENGVECQIVIDMGPGLVPKKLVWALYRTPHKEVYDKLNSRKIAYLTALKQIKDDKLRKALGNAFSSKLKFASHTVIRGAKKASKHSSDSWPVRPTVTLLAKPESKMLVSKVKVKEESGNMEKTYS